MNPIDLSALFTPLRLGAMTLPNRFVLPGMQRGWCVEGGAPQKLANYYRRRVEGGTGLVISESLAVDDPSATQNPMFAWLTAQTFESWRQCVTEVKRAGGCMLLQLWHEGAIRKSGGEGPFAQHPTLSPSGLAHAGRSNGRAATSAELDAIRAAFVRSARLAQDTGADGVEVHGAHGYLLDQFLWADTNLRDDGYGGPGMSERVRFPAEIVADIRRVCGPDFVISFRFSQWKEADFSARVAATADELSVMVRVLAGAGVDVLHASTRRFWEPEWPGSDLNLAGWSRKLSALPTVTVGSVGLAGDVMDSLFGKEVDPHLEFTLRELARRFSAGEFDLVSVGRSQIADPDWVNKVREANYAAVRAFRRADLGLPDLDEGIVHEAHSKG